MRLNRRARRLIGWCRYLMLRAPDTHALISVLVANYNGADTLEASLRSLLEQSYRNIEILVLDDASTDGSMTLLRRLAAEDRRIRLFASATNHGPFWCYNALLSKARGRYITFQASDDRSHRHRLRTQMSLLQRPGIVASVIAYARVNAADEILAINGRRQRYAHALMLFDAEALLPRLGHFDTVRFGADTEWWERVQQAVGVQAVARLDVLLYRALFHGRSLTGGGVGAHGWIEDGPRSWRSRANPLRLQYHEASRAWHRTAASLYLPFPLTQRPFPVPAANAVTAEDAVTIQEIT